MKREAPEAAPPVLALTVEQAAAAIGMKAPTLRDVVKRREIAVVPVGQGRLKGRYVIRIADLEAYLLRRRRPAAWETGAVADAPLGDMTARDRGGCC